MGKQSPAFQEMLSKQLNTSSQFITPNNQHKITLYTMSFQNAWFEMSVWI